MAHLWAVTSGDKL